jgi:hypothetical protein
MVLVCSEGNSSLPFGGLITRIFKHLRVEHRENGPTVTPLGNYNKSTIQRPASQITRLSSWLLAPVEPANNSTIPSLSSIPSISSDSRTTIIERIDGLWNHIGVGFAQIGDRLGAMKSFVKVVTKAHNKDHKDVEQFQLDMKSIKEFNSYKISILDRSFFSFPLIFCDKKCE